MGSAHRIVGRARVASAIALALVVLIACEAAESTAAGIVVNVEGTTVTDIQAFTLRTQPGQDVRFEVASWRWRMGPSQPRTCASTWRWRARW